MARSPRQLDDLPSTQGGIWGNVSHSIAATCCPSENRLKQIGEHSRTVQTQLFAIEKWEGWALVAIIPSLSPRSRHSADGFTPVRPKQTTLTTKTARIPQGERRKMQTGWPRPNVIREAHWSDAATHRNIQRAVDQDRPLALTFNDVGLREQWIPTHHCSREIKRGVMENLA